MIRITKKLFSAKNPLRHTPDEWLTNGHWAIKKSLATCQHVSQKIEAKISDLISGKGVRVPLENTGLSRNDVEIWTGPKDSPPVVGIQNMYAPFTGFAHAWATDNGLGPILFTVDDDGESAEPSVIVMPVRLDQDTLLDTAQALVKSLQGAKGTQ